MGLSSFKFVQWAPEDASILQQSAGRKRILTSNSHSRSFKVIQFAISLRPTRDSISPYNIAGLISEDSKEVATQIAKKLPSSTTTLSFDAPAKRNPRKYTLYFQKLESLAYIFVADSMGLSAFKFVQWPWAIKDASFRRQSAFWSLQVTEGHPRSMILVPIESAYATSY